MKNQKLIKAEKKRKLVFLLIMFWKHWILRITLPVYYSAKAFELAGIVLAFPFSLPVKGLLKLKSFAESKLLDSYDESLKAVDSLKHSEEKE